MNESPVKFLKTRSTVTRTVPHREHHLHQVTSPSSCTAEQPLPGTEPRSTNPTREPRRGPSCFSCRQVPEEDTGFCGPTASHFDAEHHQLSAPGTSSLSFSWPGTGLSRWVLEGRERFFLHFFDFGDFSYFLLNCLLVFWVKGRGIFDFCFVFRGALTPLTWEVEADHRHAGLAQ